jgi:hypothetical protein
MERHRPSAARTRDRSLRPPRGAATALATVLALLFLPGTAAGASESSPAPAPPPVDSALSTALTQLDSLRAQIVTLAAQEAGLQGRFVAWTNRYTLASDRVEKLLVHRRYMSQQFRSAGVDPLRLRALVWARSRLSLRLRDLEHRRDTLVANTPPLGELVRVQTLMQRLNAARVRAIKIVAILQDAQRNPALASLALAMQGQSAVSYGDWARTFLGTIGAPSCQNNLTTMVAWQAAEYTQAAWNPLATTYPMEGDGTFNGASVRNYVSLQQGLQATALTLRTGSASYGYDWILYRLATCASPSVTAAAINSSMWCHGCAGGAYVTGLIPRVEAEYDLYARL